jgi:hypothetical protein
MRSATLGLIAFVFSATAAFAAEPAATSSGGDKPKTAQQQRMTDCNQKATGKTGDDRKKFMSACLSGKDEAPAAAPADGKTAQQQKMTDCNKAAGDKKGDERKAFMSECLKKK